MKIFESRSVYILFTIIAGMLLLSSCDNPASDDHDDHEDPFGVALILNGVEIAKQENGVVSYLEGDHIELEVGEETNLIHVRWIAEDGDRFVPDTHDGYSLRWIIGNEDVLEVEQHEEDGAWAFHLVGVGAGESEIQFELWHNDHADFTSLPFEVHVEEVVAGMEIRNNAGTAIVTVDEEGIVSGSLDVNTGEESEIFTVKFFDKDGAEIETDHDFELEWHVTGSEFVTIHASDEDPFSFSIEGVTPGQAEIHFELVKEHDDDDEHGHDDETVVYESPDILINVN